jgi:hypothetical protein
MWKRLEVGREIRIDDLDMSGVDQLVDVSDRVQCAEVVPIGGLLRL